MFFTRHAPLPRPKLEEMIISYARSELPFSRSSTTHFWHLTADIDIGQWNIPWFWFVVRSSLGRRLFTTKKLGKLNANTSQLAWARYSLVGREEFMEAHFDLYSSWKFGCLNRNSSIVYLCSYRICPISILRWQNSCQPSNPSIDTSSMPRPASSLPPLTVNHSLGTNNKYLE